MAVFLPMFGSTQDISVVLPTTTIGWMVFAVTKGTVALINLLIFHCFVCQGKLNVKDNEKFIKANELLEKHLKEREPISPKQFLAKEYGIKGTTTFLFSALSVVALTNAILCFDWVAFLSYVLTLIFGIISGIIEMKKVECFWTDGYYAYALNFVSKQCSVDTIIDIPTKQENTVQEEISPNTGITEGDNI